LIFNFIVSYYGQGKLVLLVCVINGCLDVFDFEDGSPGLFAGDSEAFLVMIHGYMWMWLAFSIYEFHYVDMRLDKIIATELVFRHEVKNVLIFNHSFLI